MTDAVRLRKIWNNRTVPVILRRANGRPRLRVPCNWKSPFDVHKKRQSIQRNRRTIPDTNWQQRYWEVPKAWFDDLVRQFVTEHGQLYVIQPFREQEICASQCWNAKGHECQCSCMGANHGQGKSGSWLEVSDTFATRWGEQHLACRLITKKKIGGA